MVACPSLTNDIKWHDGVGCIFDMKYYLSCVRVFDDVSQLILCSRKWVFLTRVRARYVNVSDTGPSLSILGCTNIYKFMVMFCEAPCYFIILALALRF